MQNEFLTHTPANLANLANLELEKHKGKKEPVRLLFKGVVKEGDTLKDVPGGLSRKNEFSDSTPANLAKRLKKPSLKNGELIIPLDVEARYKWWADGQSILDTLLELEAPDDVVGKYVGRKLSAVSWAHWQGINKQKATLGVKPPTC